MTYYQSSAKKKDDERYHANNTDDTDYDNSAEADILPQPHNSNHLSSAPLKDKLLTNSSYLAAEIPHKLGHFMSNLWSSSTELSSSLFLQQQQQAQQQQNQDAAQESQQNQTLCSTKQKQPLQPRGKGNVEEPKVWLLGRAYSMKALDKVQQAILDAQRSEMFKPRSHINDEQAEEVEQEEPECPSAWPPDFYEDFTSRLWMTYRHNYPPIRPSSHKTDIGWGCMLRSGQSLLANTLLIHFLSRDWRRQKQSPEQRKQYGKIIQWFLDELSPRAPFSIHRIALLGKQLGKNIGEWFGPSTISQVLQALVSDFKPANLSVYIATDGVIYLDGIQDVTSGRKPRGDFSYFTSKIATSPSQADSLNTAATRAVQADVMMDDISAEEAKHLYENSTPLTDDDGKSTTEDEQAGKNDDGDTVVLKPVLLLVALRLGIDSLHPTYYPALKACFELPSFVGIAGGRPNSSLYFIGLEGDNLIYLDPHFSRAALETKNLKDYTRDDFNTYHCYLPRKIHISHLDPSLMLGFYCRTQKEFDQFREHIDQISQRYTSIFSIEKCAPEYDDNVRSVNDFGIMSDEDGEEMPKDDGTDSDNTSIF